MGGHRYILSGDPTMARNTVYGALESQGFKLSIIDEWNADAERGSQGLSIAFGAFAGKKGRHVKLKVACSATPEGYLAIDLIEGTVGVSGGVIGMHQANSIYSEVFNLVGSAFYNAGVLISSNAF